MWWMTLVWAVSDDPETCDGTDENLNGVLDDGAFCEGCAQSNPDSRSILVCPGTFASLGQASSHCASFGYHVWDPNDDVEIDHVLGVLDLTDRYWTGVERVDDVWVFSDGAPADFQDLPWAFGEPDGDGACSQMAAVSGSQTHTLHEVPCASPEDVGGVICEADGPVGVCDTGEPPPPPPPAPLPEPPGHVICGTTPISGVWLALLSVGAVRTRRRR